MDFKFTILYFLLPLDFLVLAEEGQGSLSTAASYLNSNFSDDYYGYGIQLRDVSGVSKLTVIAPGRVHGDSRLGGGSVYFCTPKRNFSVQVKAADCEENSFDPTPGNDSSVIDLASSITGRVAACSITSTESCKSVVAMPGFCYEFAGDEWKKLSLEPDLVCPSPHIDVLFILDGSASLNEREFEQAKNWVKDITDALSIENGTIDVGVIQYSSDVHIDIPLGYYRNTISLGNAILAIRKVRGFTFTGKALNNALNVFRKHPKRANDDKQIIILLTDGVANDRDAAEINARKLRELDVLTYAVGVGSYINAEELRLIATGKTTSNERVFTVRDYAQLTDIVTEFQKVILNYALEGLSAENLITFGYELAQNGFSLTYSENEADPHIGAIRAGEESVVSVTCELSGGRTVARISQ